MSKVNMGQVLLWSLDLKVLSLMHTAALHLCSQLFDRPKDSIILEQRQSVQAQLFSLYTVNKCHNNP